MHPVQDNPKFIKFFYLKDIDAFEMLWKHWMWKSNLNQIQKFEEFKSDGFCSLGQLTLEHSV